MSKKYRGEGMEKFKRFMKKQGYYILLALVMLLIATVITLAVVLGPKNDPAPVVSGGGDDQTPPPSGGEDDQPEPPTPVFGYPLLGGEYLVVANNSDYSNIVDMLRVAATTDKLVRASGDGVVQEVEKMNDVVNVTVYYPGFKKTVTYYGLENKGTTREIKKDAVVVESDILGTVSEKMFFKGNTCQNEFFVQVKNSDSKEVIKGNELASVFEETQK